VVLDIKQEQKPDERRSKMEIEKISYPHIQE
jgi:hypothetical protein